MKLTLQVFQSTAFTTKGGGKIHRQNFSVDSTTGPQVFQLRHFDETQVLEPGFYEAEASISARQIPQRNNPQYSDIVPVLVFDARNFKKK